MGFIGHLLTKIIAWFVGAGLGLIGILMVFILGPVSPVMMVIGIVMVAVGLLIVGTALRMLWVN